MKLSKYLSKLFLTPGILLWAFPVALIIPNIALSFTEQVSVLSATTNIIFPLGIYYLVVSATRRTALWGLVLFIVAFFAAFQIVLLNLYGESIIAIDMFINVATTSVGEASELLRNLLLAIALIVVIYIPFLIMTAWQLATGIMSTTSQLRPVRRLGAAITLIGLILLIVTINAVPSYRVDRELFPVNVISNLITAVKRTIASTHYPDTSADFTYNAVSTRSKDLKEIYVVVLGETSRADNWEILGYDRPTNPLLSKREDITPYPRTMSEANTTHKTVPMLLSWLDASNYGDSINTTKSVFEAFREAGFSTAFISNQQRNHSYIDYFGEQADHTKFLNDHRRVPHFDMELAGKFSEYLDTVSAKKVMVVLHTYGSHFNYRERYPSDMKYFTPESNSEASRFNRQSLINAYDNTIRYTDKLIDSIISIVESHAVPAALIYTSDHGEDIFDDSRERFLHSSPVATFYQLHVPFLIWISPEYKAIFPEKLHAAKSSSSKKVASTRSLFNTLIDMAGIATPYYSPDDALTSDKYTEKERLFLNDYLEGVPLSRSGMHKEDFEKIAEMDTMKI